ncbi:MAG: phosphatidylglycerol lysyltransferase domain-containing protein [bacterium]
MTSKFPAYSDFNFSNLWIWNLKGEMAISILNDNLVVKFSDYVTGHPFLSFIGDKKVNETAKELIMFSENNYWCKTLKLIPEMVTKSLDQKAFEIIPDIDSHDYVFSVPQLAVLNAWPQSSMSQGIRNFCKTYPDYIIRKETINEVSEDKYSNLFKKWSENKKIDNHFEFNEYQAFKKIFEIKNENIKIISLYLKDVLVGFSLFEIVNTDYAISHFIKADVEHHPAVYDILNWEEAKFLNEHKIKYYDWEQDLGIPGLRHSKVKYKPVLFLNKYFVKNRD